jgi:hypothetical protein
MPVIFIVSSGNENPGLMSVLHRSNTPVSSYRTNAISIIASFLGLSHVVSKSKVIKDGMKIIIIIASLS